MRPEVPAESRGEISSGVWFPEQFVNYLHCPPRAGPLSVSWKSGLQASAPNCVGWQLNTPYLLHLITFDEKLV